MKAKQKNLRIFDIVIENETDFFAYMEKNLVLLREYLLMVGGTVTPAVESYLREHGICYIKSEECNIKSFSKTNIGKERAIIEQPSRNETKEERVPGEESTVREEAPAPKPRIIDRTVRSGEEIVSDGNVVIFGRVNSGAKVIAEGAVEVYGEVDGMIQCDGDYMIVKNVGRGHIIFGGDILDAEMFDGKLKKVLRQEEHPVIKDIF